MIQNWHGFGTARFMNGFSFSIPDSIEVSFKSQRIQDQAHWSHLLDPNLFHFVGQLVPNVPHTQRGVNEDNCINENVRQKRSEKIKNRKIVSSTKSFCKKMLKYPIYAVP